ncbi:hypothetical protein Efla_005625 [Eimeria flavescens]
MQKLAERFASISSIVFFKLDVSRNDVPVPGLRVERVPHVVFFARAPQEASEGPPLSAAAATEAARAAAAAAADVGGGPEALKWMIGQGQTRKLLVTFSHAEADVLSYGEAFLLQHAACRSIDLERGLDCNTAEGKDAAELQLRSTLSVSAPAASATAASAASAAAAADASAAAAAAAAGSVKPGAS